MNLITLGNWKVFLLTFIPIFVAMGALSNVPIFIALTEGLERKEKRRVVRDSLITASLIIIAFLFIGKGIFIILGITVSDFLVAGGILLLILAIQMLLQDEEIKKHLQTVGVVPLGTPLIAGPAVLATTLILIDAYGLLPTIAALLLNIALTALIFAKSNYITRILGGGGTRAVTKITGLLLAAIAVMMLRKGIFEIIRVATIK